MSDLGQVLTAASLAPHLQGLGDLFAFLWNVVVPHTAALHTVPWSGRRVTEFANLKAAVRRHPGVEVPDALTRYLIGGHVGFPTDVPATAQPERAFTVMLVVDELAHDIHPAAVAVSPSARPTAPSRALSELRQRRWIDGHYGGGIGGTARVVPKGPIYRRLVDEDALASGDRLDTQFMALAVLEGRSDQYEIKIEAVGPKDFPVGYDPADVAPYRVGMAPVAQDRDDLVFEAVLRQERPFLDARPRDPDATRARIREVLETMRAADIVLLPELCGTAEATTAAMGDLAASATAIPVPRLIALGSALSAQCCPNTGRPYNECTVVDANGRVLWRQRKLNHFRMSERRMGECGIATAAARPHAEDVATDTILHVRDLPHFGRVIVLICEDLEQRAPGGDATYALRPDWILTPVLDVSQNVGRWTHQRGIEIARLSGARVIVSNSAILATRGAGRDRLSELPPTDVGIGLCLDLGETRSVKIVTVGDCAPAPAPVAAQFDWAPDTWGTWLTMGR